MKSAEGSHRYHVSVDFVADIDPARIEEWVEANFDTDEERVQLVDLTHGDGVSTPVALKEGPHVEELVQDGF